MRRDAQTLLWAFVLWPISGLGITAGVHRLWAHRSYDAHWSVRLFLMLANSIANQGSIFHWSRDHRVHHKHSETDADPHNATRGFFFSHMGWLLVKKHKAVVEAGKELDFSDLRADPLVVFQQRLDPWFALFMCYLMPGYVAQYGWGEDFWKAVWVAGALRYCVVLHFTWLVNSAAHLCVLPACLSLPHPPLPFAVPGLVPRVPVRGLIASRLQAMDLAKRAFASPKPLCLLCLMCRRSYGNHPYDPKSWPAENPLVSLAAIGEGWHNWHHKYPFDYAASEFGVDRQFNPTKLFIDTCAALGLVYNRKRATGPWMRLRAARIQEISKQESKKAA